MSTASIFDLIFAPKHPHSFTVQSSRSCESSGARPRKRGASPRLRWVPPVNPRPTRLATRRNR